MRGSIDLDMQVDDLESYTSGVSTPRHECKVEMFAKVSGKGTPLKESFLEALAAQSRTTNALGDSHLRTVESWRSSVSV